MTSPEKRLFHALTDPLNKFAPSFIAVEDALAGGVDIAVGSYNYRAAQETIAAHASEIMAPEYLTAFVAAGEVLNEVPADLTLLSRVWSSQRTAELMTTFIDREVVRATVMQGVGQGLSIPSTARLMRGSIGLDMRSGNALARYAATADNPVAVTRYASRLLSARAELIARTEIQAAINNGRLDGWQRAAARGAVGVMTTKTWVTAHDERVCPSCGPMDGETVRMFEDFSHGGRMPPRHPRCRCTAVLNV